MRIADNETMTSISVHFSPLPIKILVVEDEYFVAADLALALARVGAQVVGPVSTEEEALALLDAGERIDAAVLDINLRGEMVYPLADALRERGVPFVFATGYGASILPMRFRSVPRWEKPFDYQALAQSIPDILAAA